MVTVYYTEVLAHLQGDDFRFYLDKVEEERRKKILLMKNEESRLRSLTAGSLLYFALCNRMGDIGKSRDSFLIGYGKNGKPYLKESAKVHFNLSHSGTYVCCAVGDTPVGMDIQKITDVERRLAGRFFTEEDNKRLDACSSKEDRKKLFFQMWSIKESFIKLTGEGMAKGLNTFEIDWQRNQVLDKGKKGSIAYFMTCNKLEGYSACLCSWEPLENAVWKEAQVWK